MSSAEILDWPLLPSQYHGSYFSTPAQRLAFAVLEDALTVLTSPLPPPRRRYDYANATRERREAIVWLQSDRRDYPFAFAAICDVLGLSVAPARYGILRMESSLGRMGFRHENQGCREKQVTYKLLRSIREKEERKVRRMRRAA